MTIAMHTKMGQDLCPVCGTTLDAATALDGEEIKPNPGDVSICIKCAHNPNVERVVRSLGFIEHEFDKESNNFYFINTTQ